MLGVGCGIAAAIATTRTLQSFLYEVSPVDPGSFLLASVVLMAAALTAAYLPARRVARVDPAVTLRHE
jgi:ABC-type lipoprotein release transport system permease subunit